jgi:nucleotide-binding universal stress UspA family protein
VTDLSPEADLHRRAALLDDPLAHTGLSTYTVRVAPSAPPSICAFEDTETSRHALRAATWLAQGLGAPLVLAHAFDPTGVPTRPLDEMARLSITEDDLEREAHHAAQGLLESTARTATDVELATELLEGQPVPELQRLASQRRAAVLVTGTAARGGLDRFLIGSGERAGGERSLPPHRRPPRSSAREPRARTGRLRRIGAQHASGAACGRPGGTPGPRAGAAPRRPTRS